VSPDTPEGGKQKRKKRKNKKRRLSSGEEDIQVLPTSTAASNDDSPLPSKVAKKKNKKQGAAGVEVATQRPTQPLQTVRKPTHVPFQVAEKAKEVPVMNGVGSKKKIRETPSKKKQVQDPVVEKTKEATVLNCGGAKKKIPIPGPVSASTPFPAVRASPRFLDVLFGSQLIKDSVVHGKEVFEWLIRPTPTEQFFAEHWEKKPLHVKRSTQREYYSWLMSSDTLDLVMRQNFIKFGKNIDITSYVDGVRETHNPDGRALPAVVWDYYSNGNSVRFLNPQTYIKPVWKLNASLQVMNLTNHPMPNVSIIP